jgi:hypothetical protein
MSLYPEKSNRTPTDKVTTRAGRLTKGHVVCFLILFGIIFAGGCVTPPPQAALPPMGKVFVIATISQGQQGMPGLSGSTIGAADQAFTEVLLQRGYRVVSAPKDDVPPPGVTHFFEVNVNEAYAEPNGGKRSLQVSVASKLKECTSGEIILAKSTRAEETDRKEGAIVPLVDRLAREVAALFPPASHPVTP